jgi:putative ABC transport system permease protein
MADKLFPEGSAVGKSFHMGSINPSRIIGIVEHLARPIEGQGQGPDSYEYSVIYPLRMPYTWGSYLIRTDPARRAEVLQAAVDTLQRNASNRIILRQRTLDEMRANYYSNDRSMMWMLLIVIVSLLLVTALGIVGLASFWVQQRTRQIGVRRALGATKAQISSYFQTENFILASAGIALGMLLAFSLNQLLMVKYELPRLPWIYLPVGALSLWALGQLAVLWPARRAAEVPPAVATRSV